MENGIQALKIASGMLIFVIAITITISAFTSASQAINRIFAMKDSDEYVTVIGEDGKEHYLNYVDFRADGGTREVGVETIIPSIYRAYKENYAIYFYESNGEPFILYEIEKGEETIEVNYIDLEKEVHPNAEKAMTIDSKKPNLDYEEFLDGETRYAALKRTFPEHAEVLFKAAKEDAEAKYEKYKALLCTGGGCNYCNYSIRDC